MTLNILWLWPTLIMDFQSKTMDVIVSRDFTAREDSHWCEKSPHLHSPGFLMRPLRTTNNQLDLVTRPSKYPHKLVCYPIVCLPSLFIATFCGSRYMNILGFTNKNGGFGKSQLGIPAIGRSCDCQVCGKRTWIGSSAAQKAPFWATAGRDYRWGFFGWAWFP